MPPDSNPYKGTPPPPSGDLDRLDPEGSDGSFLVVIETPKGSRNKFKWSAEMRVFTLSKVLPIGAVFPFDFGFVPSTLAEDGDPIDVLLLMDEPAFPGCVVATRLIGVVEATQTERDGNSERNDRLIGVAAQSQDWAHVRTLSELGEARVKEIEHFFRSYNELSGRRFEPRRTRGPETASQLVGEAIDRARRQKQPGPAAERQG